MRRKEVFVPLKESISLKPSPLKRSLPVPCLNILPIFCPTFVFLDVSKIGDSRSGGGCSINLNDRLEQKTPPIYFSPRTGDIIYPRPEDDRSLFIGKLRVFVRTKHTGLKFLLKTIQLDISTTINLQFDS